MYSNKFLIDYMIESNICILSFNFLFVCILYIKCFHWGIEGFPLRFVCLLLFSRVGEIISRELITKHCCYFWNCSPLSQWLSWKQKQDFLREDYVEATEHLRNDLKSFKSVSNYLTEKYRTLQKESLHSDTRKKKRE